MKMELPGARIELAAGKWGDSLYRQAIQCALWSDYRCLRLPILYVKSYFSIIINERYGTACVKEDEIRSFSDPPVSFQLLDDPYGVWQYFHDVIEAIYAFRMGEAHLVFPDCVFHFCHFLVFPGIGQPAFSATHRKHSYCYRYAIWANGSCGARQ